MADYNNDDFNNLCVNDLCINEYEFENTAVIRPPEKKKCIIGTTIYFYRYNRFNKCW